MKIGKYPVASLVLLVVFGAKLFVKYFFPANYTALLPVFDDILLAAVVIFLLYYIRVWVGAWLNNRKEDAKS
ncbi:MAG: hypothetical protein JWQ79_2639 [Mucilaginibacter sp.]|jgi:hypothetical protein|nr:hypothetical protein [Mucilaginibacter sp.]